MKRDDIYKILDGWKLKQHPARSYHVAFLVDELRAELDHADELHFDEVCELKRRIVRLENQLKVNN